MPLPDGGAWPPKRLTPVYGQIATWSAWYAGDVDHLAGVYGGQVAAADTTGFFNSERGGIARRAARGLQRWFWGTLPTPTEQRTKLHIPIAGDLATASADLLFSEPPSLSVSDKTTQDRLDVLVDDGVHATLLEAADVSAGLGGTYLRVCWDSTMSDKPWLAAVHPDAAVPEWSWHGMLHAVTFWRVLADDGRKVIRHLERHEPGAIIHGVYEGDADTLGHRVPLTEYEATRGIAAAITDAGDTIATGVKGLTAEYIPNMRPARCWRTTPAAAYQGRADFSGVEPEMDALDEAWSSLMRDLRLAKARLIIPDEYLQTLGRGQGARFDAEQEIYSTLKIPVEGDGAAQISEVQFAIRVDDHLRIASELVAYIARTAGYSVQTLGEMGDVAVTATEVHARERRSFITRDRKIVYWRPALRRITQTLLEIDVATFHTAGVVPELPDIQFGDTVSEDPKAVAETLNMLHQAAAISTEYKVRMLHPDWDDTAVFEERDRILAETGQTVADPGTFTGVTTDPVVGQPPTTDPEA